MAEERLKQLLAEVVEQAAIQPSVLRLVDAGAIPFVLYGRTRMYRRRDIIAYIDGMETYRGGEKHGVA